MTKLISYGLIICFVSHIMLSCKKLNDIDDKASEIQSKSQIDFFSLNPKIADAKNYFESHVFNSPSQRFKKTPLWEKAFNANMVNGEKVLVPLKYDKAYSFKTSFSGNKKLILEEQSFLSVYKDVSDNYHAEVITIYPDQSFLDNTDQTFQGLLTIDDWNENRLKTYLYKDGKLYDVQKPFFNSPDNSTQISGRTNEICMTVYWFWCEGWESNLSQCTYVGYTTYENCADYQALQPPGEGGEYVDQFPVNTTKLLDVWSDDWCQIIAPYQVYGEKSYTRPSLNHFTNVVLGNSYLNNYSICCVPGPGGCVWSPITSGWSLDTHGESVSTDNVSVSLSGHWLRMPVQWVEIRWNATGPPVTETKVRNKVWFWYNCF